MIRSTDTETPILTRADAETLLFTEARILDERRFEDWLDLFSQDCLYWLPIVDVVGEPSLIHDNRDAMEERVFRLLNTTVHAQIPASRTQHDVSNLEVDNQRGGGAIIRCNQVVHEVRVGAPGQNGIGSLRSIPARCEYKVVWEDDWKIREKKCLLLQRDLPLYNLTFIF